MSLVALQREFRSLLTDQDAAPVALGVNAPASGLAVYRNNYRSQLMACLEQSFPCLLGWLGDDAFALAAAAHVVRVEPSDWSLDAYPASFAVTLADLYPDDPEVAELARLEADLDEAFVAGDATPLAAGTLDDVDWDRATFSLVPSLIVRDVTTNAPALWSALAASLTPPTVDRLAISGGVIVWRSDFISCFRATDAIELDALRFILAKRSFGSLCQRLIETLGSDDGTARAGALLGQWLRDGLIIAIQPE